MLRKDEGAKPATINRELAMLSKAFNLAVKEWEWLKENPVSKVPKEKEDNERDRWLTGDEEKKLLENCPKWLSEIVIFALNVLIQKSKEKVRSVNGLVFVSSVSTKINPSNLRRAYESALEKAGIEDFKFHDLRHTFATRLAQRGVDIYKIAKLLGHEDIRMTQRYSHHCPESLRDGVLF